MTINIKEDYIGFLDGIRGLMAFWVFFYHLQLFCIGTNTFWGVGALAVDIFMLLSGFLMAYHWHIRENKFDNFRNQSLHFYIKRFFRIAPLYFTLITIAYLGQPYFFKMIDYVRHIVPLPWATNVTDKININLYAYSGINIWDILSHYTFLFGFIPKYANSLTIGEWSIGLEMQFYLIFPLLMVSIARFGAFSTVITLGFVAIIANKFIGNFPFPSLIILKVNIFAAGICLAFAYFNKNDIKAIKWIILTITSLSTSAMQVMFFAVIICFMLYFDNEKNELFHKLSSNRLARFVGDTSYSVYLTHLMIMVPVLYILFHYSWFMELHRYLRLLLSFVLIVVPVYFLSYVTFKLVELPGIYFGKKVLQTRNLTKHST